MGNGFLDSMPDLGMGGKRPNRKKRPVPKAINEGPVLYIKVRCPKCRSTKVPVYDSSHLPIRYHKCTECGHNFKSIEKGN